jgi:rhodanese-related sulfurtransferase
MAEDEISVLELSELLEGNPDIALIDVREQEEFDEVNLGGTLIPLSEFEARWQEVPRDKPVYLYCRSGRRSRTALETLKKQGYTNGYNVTGGILAWLNEINPNGRCRRITNYELRVGGRSSEGGGPMICLQCVWMLHTTRPCIQFVMTRSPTATSCLRLVIRNS